MTLLSPIFLWAFLAILPLAAIYFLKVKPRRHVVTAAFLWQLVYTEKKSTSLFKKLRDLLSLLLMLLALCALVMSMTRPRLESIRQADLLLLIDHSASMSSTNSSTSRLDQAKKIAREIVDGVGDDRRVAIASVADRVDYLSYLSDDTRKLREAISSIQPTCLPLRSRALNEIAPVVRSGNHMRVVLLSDGVASKLQLPDGVEWIQVAKRSGNAGIVAADLQAVGKAGQLSLFFQLASDLEEPVEADLRVIHGDVPIKVLPVTVQPGHNEPQRLDITGGPGVYELQLDLDDTLKLDNVAHLSVQAPQPIRVAVRADDKYFFQHSVQAFAKSDGRLVLADGVADITIDQSGPGDGALSVIFAPQGEAPWWTSIGDQIDQPIARRLVDDHSALRYVPVEEMPFTGARHIKAAKGSLVLVEDEQGIPLIWQAKQAGRTAIVVNLDPSADDFVFSPYFPILIYSLTTYLGGQDQPLMAVHRTVDRVVLPGSVSGSTVTLTQPDGTVSQLTTDERAQLTMPGVHLIDSDLGQSVLASALLDAGETGAREVAITPAAEPIARGWSIAMWLMVIALLLLAVEELAYHRRKVG